MPNQETITIKPAPEGLYAIYNYEEERGKDPIGMMTRVIAFKFRRVVDDGDERISALPLIYHSGSESCLLGDNCLLIYVGTKEECLGYIRAHELEVENITDYYFSKPAPKV